MFRRGVLAASFCQRANGVMSGRVLICGVSGQDGSYLSKLLLDKEYAVFGTSRDSATNSFHGLEKLGIRERVTLLSMQPTDFRSVLSVLEEVRPDEIYNLSGQSSVGLSFDQPLETFSSVTTGTLNLLECLRHLGRDIRFYNAASSEMFGNTGNMPADETTAFRPVSPYATCQGREFLGGGYLSPSLWVVCLLWYSVQP